MCGPTVYDYSHLGHARTYVGFDIVRRVLEDYFQFNINYVVNVTDIDDKIIKKANLELAWKVLSWAQEANVSDPYVEEALKILEKDKASKVKEEQLTTAQLNDIIVKLKLVSGDRFTEEQHKSFADTNSVSRKFEALFWEDMKQLNVKLPTTITRVTEYVPEVVAYIQKIIDNGYAYESNGSVYFDVQSYKLKNHNYGKLEPWSTQQVDKLLDAEGEWNLQNIANCTTEKRNPFDFALWKTSRPGEPSWESPWGLGRPGWHIECSAMASELLGDRIDFHSGGIDLKFPHHDNELAQSEGHFDHDQWINYFLHTGHLHIDGRSMSKSQKNFITIRESLEWFSPNQMRILFLRKQFNESMDYSKSSMDEAKAVERLFANFFLNVKAFLRDQTNSMPQFWRKEDKELYKELEDVREKTHEALLDNINTKVVIDLIIDLIAKCNIYMKEVKEPRAPLLLQISQYITRIFRAFGLIDANSFGFNVGEEENGEKFGQLLDIFCSFRDEIRNNARSRKDSEALKSCDKVRDESLPNLGVRLEDSSNQTVWKLEDPQVLKTEIQRKILEAQQKEEAKRKLEEAKLKKQQEKFEKSKIPPNELFITSNEYSQLDENGIPTHDTSGELLSKSNRKKLEKLWNAQKKLHEEYLKSTQSK